MNINLYQIFKRRNSTKLPDNKIMTVTGRFTNDTSITTPSFTLNVSANQNIAKFNYIGISWPNDIINERYYWVVDKIITTDGQIDVTCSEDVFATFRNTILNSKQTITRCSVVKDSDEIILDSNIQTDATAVVNQVGLYNPFTSNDGQFIFGILAREVTVSSIEASGNPDDWVDAIRVNSNGDIIDESTGMFTRGGITYIGMNYTQSVVFMNWLLSLEGREADTVPQTLVSCIYVPINPGTAGLPYEKVETAFVFLEKLPSVAYKITHTQFSNVSDGILKYNNITSRTGQTNELKQLRQYMAAPIGRKCLNYRPYHNCELIFGPFGTMTLPYEQCGNKENGRLNSLDLCIDLCTGAATLFFKVDITLQEINAGFKPPIINSISIQLCPIISLSTVTSDSHLTQLRNLTDTATGLLAGGGAMLATAPRTKAEEKTIAKLESFGRTTRVVDTVVERTGGGLPFAAAALTVGRSLVNFGIQSYQNSIPQTSVRGANGTFVDFAAGIYAIKYTDYKYALLENEKLGVAIYEEDRLSVRAEGGSSTNGVYVECNNAMLKAKEVEGYVLYADNKGITYSEQSLICDQLNNGIYLE